MTTDLARWQFATTSIYHFLFVPVTIGLAFLVALAADELVQERQPDLQAAHQVLRDPAADQRGRRRGDRSGPGVRVRDELVELLPLRRQHLRRSPGHGGSGGLLPRVHLPGHLDLRVGSPLEEAAPDLHLAGGGGLHAVGPVHHGGQLVDAAPGGLRDELPAPAPAHRHLGPLHQSGVPVGLPARDPGLAGDRRHHHAGVLRLASEAQELRRCLPPDRHHLAGRPRPGRLRQHVHRERARCGRGQVPADEDRRRRGAVEHLSVALPVLGLPDRRREQRRDPHPDHRDPRPAVDPRHQPPRRRGPGHEQPAGPVREAVRAGQLHPQRLHPVLGDAGHGLHRRADRAVRVVGPLAHPPQDSRARPSGSS